jgi:hypothetical protein
LIWLFSILLESRLASAPASSASQVGEANADFAVQMVVPPGSAINRITTFMRELSPGNHWM